MARCEIRLALTIAIACLAAGPPARAAIVTSTFQVSASVPPVCTIAASNMAFGAYDPFAANAAVGLDASATLTVTCTHGLAGAVAVDGGLNGGAGGDNRQMVSGTQRLTYQIFRDPARTTVWQAGPAGAAAITGGGALRPERIVLFGRIPPGQVVLSGRYTDTITATMLF